MNVRLLLSRARGKSVRSLARRAGRELARRARAGNLRRRLLSVTAVDIAKRAGEPSLRALWAGNPLRALGPLETQARELRSVYARTFAENGVRLREDSERILLHEFDLLGSGPVAVGPEIDWHTDFKSGRRWDPDQPSHRFLPTELDRPSDVKVPWELSRGQHLTRLAQAWVLFGDKRAPREFQAQVRSWIQTNAPGSGVNWVYAMDVALRAVSWIWSLALLSEAPLDDAFVDDVMLALWKHGAWIAENLETSDPNGNHFLADTLGLVACGALFAATPEGARWLKDGAAILESEIRSQVGEDGVDFEGSVPYHRLALEIFLVGRRLLEVAGVPHSKEFDERLERMISFVHAYVTPEGLSPVIGDADDGRALILGHTDVRDHRYLLSTGAILFGRSDFKSRAGRLWEDSLWLLGPAALGTFEAIPVGTPEEMSGIFSDSGFCVLRSRDQYLFVDAGPVGFAGRGGHGHNDCLSFEWHALGRPLITDSGSYVYTSSVDWRNRFRSTAFHNTIRVDEEEINRIPSPLALFSLRNDAIPLSPRLMTVSDADRLEAGHTGYRRLRNPVTVRRVFDLGRGPGNAADLDVLEVLEGQGDHLLEFFFHAAPGAEGREVLGDRPAVDLSWADGITVRIFQRDGPPVRWEKIEGWFSPSYGVKVPRPVWRAWTRQTLPVRIGWRLTARVDRSPDDGS